MPNMGWEGGKCRANKTNKNIREVASINNLSRYKQRSEIAKTILDQSIEKTKPARVNKERKGLVWCTHLIPETTNTYIHRHIHSHAGGHTCNVNATVGYVCQRCMQRKETAELGIGKQFLQLVVVLSVLPFPPLHTPQHLLLLLCLHRTASRVEAPCVCFADEFTWLRARH